MKEHDYGVTTLIVLVLLGFLFELLPSLGRGTSWLAGILMYVAAPLALGFACLTQVRSRESALYVGLSGAVLVAIVMFPFDFARALRYVFGND